MDGCGTAAYFFDRIDYNDEERVGHGEQHPDIDHLDVSGARQISGYPDEAENITEISGISLLQIFTKW